jgi:hypothetical protein
MAHLRVQSLRGSNLMRLACLLIAGLAYLVVPRFTTERFPQDGHFPRFAAAFLRGGLSIPVTGDPYQNVSELIPSADGTRVYCPYPPVPAILLMPFVAIWGPLLSIKTACRVASLVDVLLVDLVLARLPTKLGRPPLSPVNRSMLTLFFALGSPVWHSSYMGGDWHYAHSVAMGGMLLALWEFCGKNRPLLIGAFVSLALCTRPTAAFTAVFFLIPLLRGKSIKQAVLLMTIPIVSVGLLAAYNHARFGAASDFGYSRMILMGWGQEMMTRYGQFHPHFIPINAFYFFVAPPWTVAEGGFAGFGYSPLGMSLFIGSPLTIYALIALVRERKNRLVTDAAICVAVCLVPLLLYFNTGFWQFGHRFGQDYLPVLMLLIVAGMKPGKWTWPIVLTVASILIQAIGVLRDPIAELPRWMGPSLI